MILRMGLLLVSPGRQNRMIWATHRRFLAIVSTLQPVIVWTLMGRMLDGRPLGAMERP